MKKAAARCLAAMLAALLFGCAAREAPNGHAAAEGEAMEIEVAAGEIRVVYRLNDSKAARDLYAQLPLTVDVEDFSDNEKIFYPPAALDTAGAPLCGGAEGTLAYYAPWGDVVMFYAPYSPGASLFALGEAVRGAEDLEALAGTITIAAAQASEN